MELLDAVDLPQMDDLQPLLKRLEPFAPWQNFAPLRECALERFRFERDQPIWTASQLEERLYVIEEGFAFDFTLLPGGKRHIFDFYGPGAICNWSRPERSDAQENILFKARTEVTVLDRACVSELLAKEQSIAGAIGELEIRRAMRVSQRVRALISLPAKDRLRILLLDLHDEFSAGGEIPEWLPMPLTQEEIGDLIGSTSVHVSRTMASLENEGEIERRATNFLLTGVHATGERMSYRRFGEPNPSLQSGATP